MHIKYIVFYISTLSNEIVFYGILSIQRKQGSYNMYNFKEIFYLCLAEVVCKMRLHPNITPYPMFYKVLFIWQNLILTIPPTLICNLM
jgi:hypothetical protein